jgi:hypothetical protein
MAVAPRKPVGMENQAVTWTVSRKHAGTRPQYLGVICKRFCWTTEHKFALRFDDEQSAANLLAAFGNTDYYENHFNGTETIEPAFPASNLSQRCPGDPLRAA